MYLCNYNYERLVIIKISVRSNFSDHENLENFRENREMSNSHSNTRGNNFVKIVINGTTLWGFFRLTNMVIILKIDH